RSASRRASYRRNGRIMSLLPRGAEPTRFLRQRSEHRKAKSADAVPKLSRPAETRPRRRCPVTWLSTQPNRGVKNMEPLDIPRLNWEDTVRNSAVAAAYQDLKRLTSRTIALHSRSLVPKVPESFYCAWRVAIHIFIEESSPQVNHSTVHELLHAVLVEEGYH